MEREFEKGLLIRNLPVEVDRSDGLSTQLDLKTKLTELIANFGEKIEQIEMAAAKNMALVTFKNKYLDLDNVKDCFDGLLFEDWPPIFVEVICGFFQARRKREEIERPIDRKVKNNDLKNSDGVSRKFKGLQLCKPDIKRMLGVVHILRHHF